MGHLIYGVAPAIHINDRALKHLQAVITTKLRRGESFTFDWNNESDTGRNEASADGTLHGSAWISPAASRYFSYDAPTTDALNPEWLRVLSASAANNGRLVLLPEPDATPQ